MPEVERKFEASGLGPLQFSFLIKHTRNGANYTPRVALHETCYFMDFRRVTLEKELALRCLPAIQPGWGIGETDKGSGAGDQDLPDNVYQLHPGPSL